MDGQHGAGLGQSRWAAAIVAMLVAALLMAPAVAQADEHDGYGGDWSDSAYLEHDLDNYLRARGRTAEEALSLPYHQSFLSACLDSQGRSAVKQLGELTEGRLYGGVGQATCWWSVGHAPDYFDQNPQRVHFVGRNGAKLQGHVWGAASEGPRPGIVLTTGSIQASDQMYWWAARALAAAGYVVLTYDVQGQGQSETFAHEPGELFPGLDGVPSQQEANFTQGTIDALRFFLSTPDEPYVPGGWDADDVAAEQAASGDEPMDWHNPAAGVLDREHLGIAGHSLGASAVSQVQMCSDEGELWRELELCDGESYPIRAVIGWDALSSNVTPVVPAMSQLAEDGYFLFPTLSPSAPEEPEASLAALDAWTDAGLDAFVYAVRGGTHIEWSQVPYTSATNYGVHMNTFYTLQWFNRHVWPDEQVQQDAHDALLAGPLVEPEDPTRAAANYMSVRRYSGFHLTAPDTGEAAGPSFGRGRGNGGPPAGVDRGEGATPEVVATRDIRHDYAGLSTIGDWAGANEDDAGAVTPDQVAGSLEVLPEEDASGR